MGVASKAPRPLPKHVSMPIFASLSPVFSTSSFCACVGACQPRQLTIRAILRDTPPLDELSVCPESSQRTGCPIAHIGPHSKAPPSPPEAQGHGCAA